MLYKCHTMPYTLSYEEHKELMKIKKTIRLSEEATAALADIDNHSQYIEDLILGTPQGESKTFEVVPLKQLTEVLGTLLEEINNNQISATPLENKNPKNTIVSPTANIETYEDFLKVYSVPGQVRPPHPEYGYPCCHNKTRCKHWEYDEMESELKNNLTGAVVDVSF